MVFTYQKAILQKAEVELTPVAYSEPTLQVQYSGITQYTKSKIHTWLRAMYGFLGKSLPPV